MSDQLPVSARFRSALSVLGVALAVALSSCGGEGTTTTTTIIQPAPAGDSDTSERPKSLSQDSGGATDLMPDLAGERLDVAEDQLEDAGIPFEEIGGGTFGVVNVSAWTVCETRPAEGEPVDGTVKLIVDRPGSC